jgi:hypothetical protein
MKSALFVDFDNIYSSLRQFDQATADRFARHPMEWMHWIVNSLALPDHATGGAKRRVLVRRCYLNPQAYQRFRPFFNLAGFEIIDCPALTTGGKTSTDIHMVLDIIDLLQHEARYDEFIVFSADADFTPVLRKLRRWDRRTTVLAIGFPSAAYRASADLVIDQDEFVRDALGIRDKGLPVRPEPSPACAPAIVRAALAIVRTSVMKSATPVPLASVAAEILSRVKGIDASTWAGYGSFRGLLQANDLSPLLISSRGGGNIYEPSRHQEPEDLKRGVPPVPEMLAEVVNLIRRELHGAQEPVPCARIATTIADSFTMIAADWNGKGTFRKFLESIDLAPLAVHWDAGGGCIYDPGRHAVAERSRVRQYADDWSDDYEILAIVRQIHEVTSVPLLSPNRYRILFEEIVEEVRTNSFDFIESGKRIRDRCRDAGSPIGRADVAFVLRGLLLRGHKFDEKNNAPKDLGRTFANQVRSLCLHEQIILDIPTDAAICCWIEQEKEDKNSRQSNGLRVLP